METITFEYDENGIIAVYKKEGYEDRMLVESAYSVPEDTLINAFRWRATRRKTLKSKIFCTMEKE